ncbi:MCM DNA helicase complex subunit [Ascosphaera aggregata]|nr:MCM DNA helicase complex subunit [Ascosphaera aggregata]
MSLTDQGVEDRVRLAAEFLDPSDPRARSLDEIRSHSAELAHNVLTSPFDYTDAFNQALKQVVNTLPNRTSKETNEETMYYCAFIGAFGEYACNPRTLTSSHLNRLISLEGIVTRCSLVRPKIIRSVHYNEKKDEFLFRTYRDQTMTASGATNLNVYPQQDDDENPVSSSAFRSFSTSASKKPTN